MVDRIAPPLEQDDVLVRMIASPINPSDLIPIRGAYKHRIQLPAIPGYEGVGIVEKVGSSMYLSLLGRWQTYVTTKAHYVVPVPDEIDDDTASQMYINPMTAWLICTDELKLRSGDVLIVNACGSAIGRIFAQLSRIIGYKLIAIVRSSRHTEDLYSLGASAVIDSSQVSVTDSVMELTNGMGATAGIDSIGGQDGEELIACIRSQGSVLSIGLLSGTPINWLKVHELYPRISVRPYWLRQWLEGASHSQWHGTFDSLFKLVMKKHLIIQQAGERYCLSDFARAIEAAESQGRQGKVLLIPSTSSIITGATTGV
ncbi:NADPH:quinone reductase-like Zn-dependent oxidoreductase [Paenibacillus cellulosilyticus]|uniref:NADPH:quinone reductase-like Zn-dependent oxidoreductase n=2 Tax=Paenibacillus cellulosilyticus TaxID=375489 RepID=A0A2V2YW95_9BACL|nr:zinc-dependent alcohol dehydrogenase family protein [Paenibacillus cellulosilyticus]PWW04904.1 NADPH:quinone reductase-like Zn-dependent oxidoreductase [Paenibacillus cellulosilyticus]QKS46608.1 zinc-dependent alcohol dehydrogenase family protein [Paenibacillus cellulosilyticus]